MKTPELYFIAKSPSGDYMLTTLRLTSSGCTERLFKSCGVPDDWESLGYTINPITLVDWHEALKGSGQ